MAELRVFEDPAAVVAERLERVAAAGGHIALSGGSTPRRAYELLAAREPDLSGATLWYGDERCVAPEDESSNHRMVARALLEPLADGRRPRVHRIEGELGPDEAADRYEALLRVELGDAPVLDLAVMGLGPDGHTASLFPAKPEAEETQRLAVAVPEAGMEPYVPRVSLTLPVFNAAREVLFLVAGEGKADAVRRAFGPDPDRRLPAAHVRPRSGRLVLALDPAAAARLP